MDDHEFEKVFWELQPQLVRHANHHLDPTSAEDAVAEALLSLWNKKRPFPDGDVAWRQLRALAFQILIGIIRNEHRARRRRRNLRGALESNALVLPQDQPESAHVLSQLSVDRWLTQLSEAERELMLLINAGFDIKEVAQILRCSVSAAAKRRTRARTHLQTIIEAERRSTV